MAHIAIHTLRAIDAAVAKDGGNTFRGWLGRVIPHIGDAYRTDEQAFRTHMGASTIGRDCAREIWYGFHWVTYPEYDGRMLQLWNRGHLEEARFIALLLTIGCNVIQQDENGKQFRISELGGHYGGSGDGMAENLPDIGPTRALTEFKTHNDKSFKKLAGSNWNDVHKYVIQQRPLPARTKMPTFEGEGLRVAKPDHYIQMQQYMRKMGLPVGMYFAKNKNDDHTYAEVVPLDTECADRYTHRAIELIPMRLPPKRISESPSWFACKFCDHKAVCHQGAPVHKTCRSCEHSRPEPDGTWTCSEPSRCQGRGPLVLSKEEQRAACPLWVKMTGL